MKTLFFILALVGSIPLFAQFRIEGKIMDPEKGPLAGATVLLQGTTIGTITDSNGFFQISNLKAGKYVLKVSFIGYVDHVENIELNGVEHVEIALERDLILTEEVFVTSTRAGTKTPVASTEMSTTQIRERNLGQDVPYLLNSTPSFVATSDAGTGIGYTGFRIRGTDANRINVTINGIPFNEAESHDVYWVDLPDISSSLENIEIQRGVGTSTQGAAAFGATINMQTSALRKDAYAGYSGSFGSFNTMKNTFSTGSGLLRDHFSFDARLSTVSSDGFIDRAFTKMNSYYLSGGYYSPKTIMKLIVFSGKERTYQAWNGVPSVRLNSDTEGMLRYEEHGLYTQEETEAMLASHPRTYNLYTYDNETDNYQQDHYQLLFNQKFGDYINLNAALFLTHGEGYYEQYETDEDFEDYGMENVIVGNDTITSTDLIRQKWLDNNFYGGTFSLNYEKEKTDFILGAGWNQYDGNHFGKVIWAQYMGDTEKDFEWYRGTGLKTDFNVFAKYNYAFNKKGNLYADVQYRNISHSIGGIDDDLRDLTQDHHYNFFNPKLGVFFRPTTNSKAYLSWAVGHREPNRSNFTDADPNGKQPTFETLNDFELGYNIASNTFSAGANLYYMHYKDQLILTGEINDVGSAIMTNVDDSYRAGIELMLGCKILPTLDWNVNLAISQNKIIDFVEYVDDWDTWGQDVYDLGNTDIAFSPKVVMNSQISFRPISNLRFDLVSQYVGKQYIDNSMSNDRVLDAYFVNNLKAAYSFHPQWCDQFQINLLVNNLLNAEYETNAWVYSYIYGGERYKMDGYFPQAGANFLLGIDIRF